MQDRVALALANHWNDLTPKEAGVFLKQTESYQLFIYYQHHFKGFLRSYFVLSNSPLVKRENKLVFNFHWCWRRGHTVQCQEQAKDAIEMEENSPPKNSKSKLNRPLGAEIVQVFLKKRTRGRYFTFRRALLHHFMCLMFPYFLLFLTIVGNSCLFFMLQNSENFKHLVITSG